MSKENVGQSGWMEGGQEPQPGGATWKRWALIGGIAVLIVAGVAGGIAGWKLSTKDDNASAGLSSSQSTSGTASGTVGSDPSKFTLDSRLHKSFYGLAYSPAGAICAFLSLVASRLH